MRFGGKDRPFKKPISLQRVHQSSSYSSQSSYDSSRMSTSRQRSRSRSPHTRYCREDRGRQSSAQDYRRGKSNSPSTKQRDLTSHHRRDRRDYSRSRSPNRKGSKHKVKKERHRSCSSERHKKHKR